ncbi:MAG: hypothetical protein NTX24_01480 [Candidatus Pacearchaeota archaeon]|nr:hypothetical protein [Candidatus Pacearchaeota archaeon]
MEIVSRISRGSKMDQIYIPKNRAGLGIGDYVLIKLISLEEREQVKKQGGYRGKYLRNPFLYGVSKIEPIKMEIINRVFGILSKFQFENVIITGSILEMGFNFNDMDLILISEEQDHGEKRIIENQIMNSVGIKSHIILLSKKTLISGLETDPIYESMISRCISRERIVFNYKRLILPKFLDLQLLKSKALIKNYQEYNGREKEYLVKNLVSISLFLEGKKVKQDEIEKKIKVELKTHPKEIRENILGKEFERNYEKLYKETFDKILKEAEKQNAKPK